ncbi:hypothetical protein [Bradyrhizobium jicamae]|uniref:hypothetical protein n=1 Tax=Bradyrhizobium jicamae TaxID=280332 RepID=UPI001BAD795A|nr:hypothetical protein [Bradyrhizobium jicamae]MBR0936986.1 hypothetical protein [Bradyrhizobium jicamae]
MTGRTALDLFALNLAHRTFKQLQKLWRRKLADDPIFLINLSAPPAQRFRMGRRTACGGWWKADPAGRCRHHGDIAPRAR